MNNSTTSITIDKKVSAVMDEIAAQIKERLNAARVLCVNFMGSPGSGKTRGPGPDCWRAANFGNTG